METRFIYRDEWDEIVSQFIAQQEPFKDYWARSEEYALGIVDKFLATESKRRLLDLGCGRGRLLERFANLFEEVVAVDADRGRIEQARRAAQVAKLGNVHFVDRLFEDCAGDLGKFDVVLCSHVIQHLPTDAVAKMLGQIEEVLLRDGVLVLLTSHSAGLNDSFKLWRLSDVGEYVIEESLENACAFDRVLVEGCPKSQLPTHAFALKSLQKLLSHYRLKAVRCFHAIHKRNMSDALCFRDDWINLPLLKGFLGIDVLLVAQRPGGTRAPVT